ncbi:MAG TPA: helix-turn-helix domain-containing protein [Pyrinomonadaceae bacterium]|nr:helix-turn-helix domain-containing protein [Pyrinomonadaceae bacterium]
MRREQILKTAVDLFSKHGFRGTTTKEIARAAGVSEAMVFKHFATKDELYGAILDNKACQGEMQFSWREDSVIGKAMEERDDHAVFYNLALNAMNKQQSDPGFMRLLFFSALEEHDLAERFFKEFVTRVYEFIGSYIEKRQKEGAMRKIEPRIAVRAFLGMMIHQSLNNILWDKKRTVLDITNETAAKNFADILLHGVAK